MPVKDQTDLWMYPMLTNFELVVTQNECMHPNTEFTCQIKVSYYLEASYKYLGTKVCVKLKPQLLEYVLYGRNIISLSCDTLPISP